MDNIEFMNALETLNNLMNNVPRLTLCEALFQLEKLAEVTTVAIFHNHVNVIGGFGDVVKLHYVRILNFTCFLQNVYFLLELFLHIVFEVCFLNNFARVELV